jgi:DNA-binding LacI/PurR family transcriptional regulator
MSETLTPHELRRIAVEAGVDPRTVASYLRGGRVVSTASARILRALEALGFSAVRRGPVAP